METKHQHPMIRLESILYRSDTLLTQEQSFKLTGYRVFFQKRLDRLRNAEIAKRNQERMRNPTLFPNVPTGVP